MPVLCTNDKVISIAHQLGMSVLLGGLLELKPKVQYVVEVDIG